MNIIRTGRLRALLSTSKTILMMAIIVGCWLQVTACSTNSIERETAKIAEDTSRNITEQQVEEIDLKTKVEDTENPVSGDIFEDTVTTVEPIRHFLQPVECWFEIGETAPKTECFRMYVPENHEIDNHRIINFPVIKLSIKFGKSAKTPVIHLGGGGPGNPMGFDTESIEGWLWDWYRNISVGDYRDLYLIDPRGVGLAEPLLVCSEYIPGFLQSLNQNLTVKEEIRWNTEVNKKCVDRIHGQGVELATYNSLNVARDVDLLRQSLGIDKWNLYGVSYGSRYALTLAREFPLTIESMILDAAVFPNIRYMDNYAVNINNAYTRLIQYCLNSESCNKTLPEPGKRFWETVRRLKSTPVYATVSLPKTPRLDKQTKIQMVLNAERFLSVFYNALYDAEQFKDLPAILTSLEHNELGIFEENITDWLKFQVDADYGDAVAAAHYCYEESPFIDYTKAIDEARDLRMELRESAIALLEFNREQCARWPVPAANAVEGNPVVSDIPTLILHGALDPVLPVENIEKQLQYFSAVDYEVFPNTSHSIVGVHPCGESIARAFYTYKLGFRSHINCLDTANQ